MQQITPELNDVLLILNFRKAIVWGILVHDQHEKLSPSPEATSRIFDLCDIPFSLKQTYEKGCRTQCVELFALEIILMSFVC